MSHNSIFILFQFMITTLLETGIQFEIGWLIAIKSIWQAFRRGKMRCEGGDVSHIQVLTVSWPLSS